jgi:hypothetical protein
LFVKIGNSLVIHSSYVGDSLDRKQNPTKLNKTSSNEMKSQMEDSSSDGSSEMIPKRKKQRTSRVSKRQLLLELIEKTTESREKAKAEREKVKAKQYEDHMALESRKLDAMMLLIQRALPEEKSQKKKKKSRSKKESDSSSTDND